MNAMDSKTTLENQDACAGLAAATGSVVEGKTAQQWHDAWLLCATGRELEWEQLCYLTAKLARTARYLRRKGDRGNGAAAWAADKLSEATQHLWLCDAEKCEHTMPKQSLTGSRVLPSPDAKATQMATADPGENYNSPMACLDGAPLAGALSAACPFCGCDAQWPVKDESGAWLECAVCHAHGPKVELEGMARPYWNRRKPPNDGTERNPTRIHQAGPQTV